MAQNIRLKRSAVSAKVPATTDLSLGELAINTYDGKMYFKKDVSGTETIIQLANDVDVVKLTGNQTIAGVKTFSDTTASTNSTTGALIVTGGIGIGAGLNVVGNVTVVPSISVPNNNFTLGLNAGAAMTSAASNCTFIGNNAGTKFLRGIGSVAIGDSALAEHTAGVTLSTTIAGSGGAVNQTITGITLEKDSGTATMTRYPTVSLQMDSSGGAPVNAAILIEDGGSGATDSGNLVLKATAGGVSKGAPAAWRCQVTGNTSNFAIGREALRFSDGANGNIAIGNSALRGNTTGRVNVAIGSSALANLTTGQLNTAIGVNAMNAATNKQECVAIGRNSMFRDAGNGNTAIGSEAHYNISSGSYNVAVGWKAGYSTSSNAQITANNSVWLGADARPLGDNQTNQIVIGYQATGNGSNTTTIGNSSTIGTYLPNGTLYVQETDDSTSKDTGALVVEGGVGIEKRLYVGSAVNITGGMTVTPNTTAATDNITIGPFTGTNISGGVGNICIGSNAGKTITGSSGSIAIGANALELQEDGARTITNTTAGTTSTVGTITGVQLTKDSGTGTMTVYPIVTLTVGSGGNVTAIDITSAGKGATVPSGIVFKTADARIDPNWRGTLTEVTANTAIGRDALKTTTTGSRNFGIGMQALRDNTTGGQNVALGMYTLQYNTTGSNNLALGLNAVRDNTTGSTNAGVGGGSLLRVTTGSNNIAVGNSTFNFNTTGSNNTAVGVRAGSYFGSGTSGLTISENSTFIGYQARAGGNSQTNQVVIGYDAIGNGSDTTTIGNSSTTGTYLNGPSTFLVGANNQSTQLGQSTTLLSALSNATVTATNLIPANCILLGVTARVTTAITGATTFDIGDGTTANRFGNDIAIALNTTAQNCIAPALITAATNVVLTANGSNFTGGAVRLTAHYMTLVAPTS